MRFFSYDFHYKPAGILTNSKPAGLSLYGIDGSNGNDGKVGSSVYFYPKTTITDNDKDTILRRIDTGYLIDGMSQATRSYTEGDLIITKYEEGNSYKVYKLVESTNTTHKFGIIFYGTIYQESAAYNIVDYYLDQASIKLNIKYESTEAKIVVNRSFDSSTELYYTNGDGIEKTPSDPQSSSSITQSYANSFKTLFGLGMTPSITFTTNSDIPTKYDFSLRITIPLQKGMIGSNGFPLEARVSNNYNPSNSDFLREPMLTNKNIVNFEKIIEIPLEKYFGSTLVDSSNGMTYFSDMSCDKLHPCGNNINVSFFDPKRSKGWETVLNQSSAQGSTKNAYWFRINIEGNAYKIVGRITNSAQFTQSAKQSFYNSNIESSFMTGDYNNWHPMMQCSKREKLQQFNAEPTSSNPCIVNFRSGESAYFSGMVPNKFKNDCFSSRFINWTDHDTYIGSGPYHTYDAYVTMNRSLNPNGRDVDATNPSYANYTNLRINQMQTYMGKIIHDFILNAKNTYELVYTEKATGYTKFKKLTFSELQQNVIQ